MDLRSIFEYSPNARTVPSGTTISEEGPPGTVVYVVLDGEVELRVRGEVLESIGPGGIVGAMALIDEKTRSATAAAITDCRLAPVDERCFHFMVHEHPFFALHVMRTLTERLRRMDSLWHAS